MKKRNFISIDDKIINELNEYNNLLVKNQMNMENFSHESIKQNVDLNILFNNQNVKQSTEKQTKSTKRELFREANDDRESKLIETRPIKKNAYIVDSDEEEETGKKQFQSQRSIDEVSQIIESRQKQASNAQSPKLQNSTPISICSTHKKPIKIYNFCIQCSQYLMCPSCISSRHSSHMILTFGQEQETKYLTKQFLIQKIEETLQKLKSKENDLKNKSTQMQLICSNVKKIEEELINKLETVFREIGDIVRNVYQREHLFYETKIDEFYHEYNTVGDQLRENLLSIIDESFDIKTFNSQSICKQPPIIPNEQINKFKSVLEKTKKFYKAVINSLDEFKQKTCEMSNFSGSSKGCNTKSLGAVRKNSTKKYEKFLSDNCYQNDGEIKKSSLIKILDTLSK